MLSCAPHTRVLPKFEFLLSKGASRSDIVIMTNRSPRFLDRSLEDHIIPTYQLLKGIFISDKATVNSIKRYPALLYESRIVINVNFLLENGVARSNIAYLLGRSSVPLSSPDIVMGAVEELKGLGFNPLTSPFSRAFAAKLGVSKSQWDAKVDAYKKWGWSEEALLEAFRKYPNCMLVSKDKIDAVMGFWVNHLGWDPLTLLKGPKIFEYSLKNRIIPRALVLQFLYSKGLRNKKASLVMPFFILEKQFLENFVTCFKEHDCQLLKIYEEKKNI
ncbi:mTERF protein [Senna tora]|uniref:mTERF protein n=1 Tax=Senna tora TaxID=362788 RepID=A0A835CCV9_9FABA|nr:mTERF protein [Senna tora]